jgi:teichuronic acid biosynthesis glycosyltransferase TuaG
MTDTLVSVIVAVHNGERYLAEAVASVLGQTWSTLECIVVNDGSTDSTPEILAAIADVRLTVIHQSNRGVSAARNTGLARATGELVAFLDADDVWLPRKLERQVSLHVARPDVVLSFTGFTVADSELRPRGVVVPRDPVRGVRRWLLLEGNGLGLSFTGVARRSALPAEQPFDESLSTSADLDFTARLARAGAVASIPSPLVLYRTHGDQMHKDVTLFERDMVRVFEKAFGGPDGDRIPWRRATANLHTRLFVSALARREPAKAFRHLRTVTLNGPSRLVLLPAGAVVRRVGRRVQLAVTRRRRS